jgi:hypothetical protein
MDLAVSHAVQDVSIDPEKVAMLKAHAAYQREHYSVADIRLAAALMKTAAEVSEDVHSDTYHTYCGLLKQATPTPGKRQLASIVYTCLGRVVLEQEKQANPLPKIVSGIRAIGGVASALIPDVFRLIALGGVGVGGIAGAGTWALNRGVTQEDEKLRQLEIQRDTYHRLNSEVKAELQRRNMEPTPGNTAAAVDYLT